MSDLLADQRTTPGRVPAKMSKSAYAKYRGRGPSAVSNWIATGRLTDDAFDGPGRNALVIVEIADRQLAENLDPGQQAGNGAGLAAQLPSGTGAPDTPAASPAPQQLPSANNHQARILESKAEQQEIETARARRRFLAEQGVYTKAEDASRAWARELADLLGQIELALPEIAERMAVQLGCDKREATLLIKREWRGLRERLAQQARRRASGQDELVADAAETPDDHEPDAKPVETDAEDAGDA